MGHVSEEVNLDDLFVKSNLTYLCSGAGTSSPRVTASASSMRVSSEAAEDNFILRHEIEIFYEQIENRIDQTKLIKIYLNFCKRVSRLVVIKSDLIELAIELFIELELE